MPDYVVRRMIIAAKAIHAIFLVLALTLVVLTLVLPGLGRIPSGEEGEFAFAQIPFSIGSVLIVLIGGLLPHLGKWRDKAKISKSEVPAAYPIRSAFFETVALFGLTLAILGSRLYVSVPLEALSAIALAMTYPSDKRLAKWQGR